MQTPVKDARTAQAAAQGSQRPPGLVHGLQELLNTARKAENRLHKVHLAKERAAEQWRLYQQGLKDAWMKEHLKYNKNVERLDRDLQEATVDQEKAYQAVRQAWTEGMPAQPDDAMGARAEETWDRLQANWAQEDEATLQSVLQRAVSMTEPGVSHPGAVRQLRPELVKLLSHFSANAPWEGPPGLGQGSGMPGPATGPPPSGATSTSPLPPTDVPVVEAANNVAPTTSATGRLQGDMQVSPSHPGQREHRGGRVPTSVEPPRQGIKPATMAHAQPDRPQGPGLSEKLNKRREAELTKAMQPFGSKAGLVPPVPPDTSQVNLAEGDTDEEMDGSKEREGAPSPGLGRMG